MVEIADRRGRRVTIAFRLSFIIWVFWALVSPTLLFLFDESVGNNFYQVMTWVAGAASAAHLACCLRFRDLSIQWPVLADSLFISSGVMLFTSLYYFSFVGPAFSLLALALSWRTRRRALRRIEEDSGPL